MKILLMGSSQIKHLRVLFENNGVECLYIPDLKKYRFKLLWLIETLKCINKVDAVYVVGGIYTKRKIYNTINLLGKPIINHWIGTDVLHAQKNLKWINKNKQKINLGCSSNICKELKDINIDAKELPIVSKITDNKHCLMPETHKVLVYLPKTRPDFYGLKYVNHLVKTFPNILFHVVANDDKSMLPYDNVVFHGTLNTKEINDLYNDISILLRIPKHDGLSMMLLEALSKGKQVIYIYDFPYVHTVKDITIKGVEDIFTKVISKKPSINYDGIEYVKSAYKSENLWKLYKEIFNEI